MTAQNDSFFPSDLTGKLIIKARFRDDVRCIPIHNEDITYEELVLMMLRVFGGQLSTKDEIMIKYKDDDGDLITMVNDTDVAFAIQCSKILKITIFVNSKLPSVDEDVRELRRLLPSLIEATNKLLVSLEGKNFKGPSPLPDAVDGQKPSQPEVGDQKTGGALAPAKVEGKEFDPLSSDVVQPAVGPQDPGYPQPPFPGSRSQTPSNVPSSKGPQPPSQFQPIPNAPPQPLSSAGPVAPPAQAPYQAPPGICPNPQQSQPQPPQQPYGDPQQKTGGGYPPQAQYNGTNRISGPASYPPPPSSGATGGTAPLAASMPYRPLAGPGSYPQGGYSMAGYPNQHVQTGLPGSQQQGYPGSGYGHPQGMGGQPQSSGPGNPGYMNQRLPASDVRGQNYSPGPPGQGNPYSRGPSQGQMYPHPYSQYPPTQ